MLNDLARMGAVARRIKRHVDCSLGEAMAILRFVFLVGLLCARSGAFAADCAANLVTAEERAGQTRYAGAFIAAIKLGALDVKDLATVCASDVPINPLAKVTPMSRNSSARALFATLADDPEVRAHWPETLKQLKAFQDKTMGLASTRADAVAHTQEILEPSLIQTILKKESFLAFSALLDGTLVVARIIGGEMMINRLSDMVELHRAKIPDATGKFDRFTWHRDEKGTAWLYFVQSSEDLNSNAPEKFYRLNFDLKTQFELLPQKYDRRLRVTRLVSVSPKVLLAKVSASQKTFNINILEDDSDIWRSPRAQRIGEGYAVDDNGELVVPEAPAEGSTRLFRIRDGRILKIYTKGSQPTFSAELDGVKENFQSPNSPKSYAVWQTQTGRILIAYLSGGSANRVNFYEFGIGSATPFFAPKFKRKNILLEWFEDVSGHPYLATAGEQVLRVIDPIFKHVPLRLEPKRRASFFRVDGQLYWYVPQEDGIKVYKMFTDPKL